MTYYNESIKKFLRDARWRLFDAGHYRHADKMDEVLTALDEAGEENPRITALREDCESLENRINEEEERSLRLENALRDIRLITREDPALGDIAKIIEEAL